MLVQIRHEKGARRHDVLFAGKKLKSGEEYDLPEGAELTLAEYNPMLSPFRFFLFAGNFLAGIVRGKFGEMDEVRRVRHVARVRLGAAREDEIGIVFSEGGWHIEGAPAETLQDEELPCPAAEKRVRRYKAAVVALSLAALAGVLALLIFAVI